MKFTITKGANPDAGVIPTDKRGVILSSTKEATEKRQTLASLAPCYQGRKTKTAE